jgi:Flp pilus assembly CpaE family ATPase
MQLLRQCDSLGEKVRVVANRVGASPIEIGAKKVEETLGLPISWQVPDASAVVAAARSKGVPLEAESPGCRAHRSIEQIARSLTAPPGPSKAPAKPRLGRFAAFFS